MNGSERVPGGQEAPDDPRPEQHAKIGKVVRTDTPSTSTSHLQPLPATSRTPGQFVPDWPELRPVVARAVAYPGAGYPLPEEREAL